MVTEGRLASPRSAKAGLPWAQPGPNQKF